MADPILDITGGYLAGGQGPNGEPLMASTPYLYNGELVRWEPSTGRLIGWHTGVQITDSSGNPVGGGSGGGTSDPNKVNTGATPPPAATGGFQLPWFPLTSGLDGAGGRMYLNAGHQLWEANQARDPLAQQFGRWNFTGGGGTTPPPPAPAYDPGTPPRELPDNGIPPWRNPPTTPPGRIPMPTAPRPRPDGGLLPGSGTTPVPTPPPTTPPAGPPPTDGGRGSGFMPPARGGVPTTPRIGGGLYPDGRMDGRTSTGGLLGGGATTPPPSTPAPGLLNKPLNRAMPADLTTGRQTVTEAPPAAMPPRVPTANMGAITDAADWGDWTQFQFSNPTEGWMSNWNALDPSLRPYYAAAMQPQQGGGYAGSGLGLRSIYAAMQAQNPSLYEPARYETNQIFGQSGKQTWRVTPTGELQQLQIPTDSWTTVASGLAPGQYVPMLPGQSAAYQGWLQALQAAK